MMKNLVYSRKYYIAITILIIILLVIGGLGIFCITPFHKTAMANTVNLSHGGSENLINMDLVEQGYVPELNITDFIDVKYIKNANYFGLNPSHSRHNDDYNKIGTCTTIAMQMMLGYHNYYSDRRLIPQSSEDGKIFLNEKFGDPNEHPSIFSKIDQGQGHMSLGTEEGVYDEIYNLTTFSDDVVVGQSIGFVGRGVKRFVEKYAPQINDKFSLSTGVFNLKDCLAEIDAGRPVGLVRTVLFNDEKSIHVVVAYGYATLNEKLGFIAHYGQGYPDLRIWIPADQFSFQIKMSVDHIHSYDIDTGNNVANVYREIVCSECGCHTLDPLYELNETGDEIVKVKYPLCGDIRIPFNVYGNQIVAISDRVFANQDVETISLPYYTAKIGESAFENCKKLKKIKSLNEINSIGKFAFRGCSSLQEYTVAEEAKYIGDGAFAECYNLDFEVASKNATFLTENNILYKYVNVTKDGEITKEKTEILHTGKIFPNITVGNTVTRIAPHAFDGNNNLKKITFKGSLEIGDEAFAHNIYLQKLIFDSDVPPASVGEDIISYPIMMGIFVPYDVKDAYRTVFGEFGSLVFSQKIDVAFDGGEVRNETKAYYYGQTVTLPVWDDIPGYYFYGWTDENGVACSSPYRFMTKNAVMLHAEISPITYNVILDSNGGELMGDNTFYATFGEECFTNTTARRKNYKLSGWADRDGNLLLDASGKSAAKWNIADDVTLYAVWEIESYEIMISDGGKYIWLDNALMLSDDNIEYGDVFVLDELAEQYALSYQGFKEGHIFTEFQLADSDLTDMPDIGESGTRRVIKPIWRKEQYRLTFNKNTYADVGDVGDIVAEFDEEITLHQPFRVGYTFMGWEDLNKSLFEYEKMPDLSPTAQEDVVLQLRARWEANTYYIFYDANGGNGGRGMDVMTELKYDNYGHLAKHTYYLEGHVFAGWARSRYGAVEYSDYDYVTNLTAEPNGRIMLYAIWRPATYRVICKNLAQGWTTSNVNFTYGVGMNTMPVIYTCNIGGRYYTLETFEGWYTSTKFQTQVTSISPWQDSDVTVYAKYTYSVVNEFDGDTYTVTDGKLENQPYFEVNFRLASYHFTKIKNTSLKFIRIDVSLNIWEVDDGYQDCYLFCGDTQIWKQTIEHGKGKKNGTPERHTLDIPLFAIENYASQDYFTLRFGAHGAFSDTWKFNDLEMHISFVNDAPTA